MQHNYEQFYDVYCIWMKCVPATIWIVMRGRQSSILSKMNERMNGVLCHLCAHVG